MKDFLEYRADSNGHITTVSLKGNISFKEFNNYFPNYSKKTLTQLFDAVESRAIMETVLFQ